MRIFLSYRRDDSSAWAGRLRDALADEFGKDNIFQDVVAVQPGQDFTDAVDAALSRSDAALAVIGPRWLTAAGVDGEPRLADESRLRPFRAGGCACQYAVGHSGSPSAGRRCPPRRSYGPDFAHAGLRQAPS